MNWKKLTGRILTAAVAIALAVFAIIGKTPPWYAAIMAVAIPVINVVIGEWKPPE